MVGARLRDIAEGRRDALNIDPKLILIEKGFNPRDYSLPENRDHLDVLKGSIRQMGVKVPVLVRWDGAQAVLIDGECRLRACLELIKEGEPIKTIPTLQEPLGDPSERLLLAISANTGKPLSMIEAGGAFVRLQAFGWSIGEITEKSGFKRSFVSDAMMLAMSPRDVKEMVSNGSVTPSLAKQVVRQKGDKAADTLKEKVSQAQAKGKTTAKREAKPSKAKSTLDDLMIVGDQMSRKLVAFENKECSSMARRWNMLRGIS